MEQFHDTEADNNEGLFAGFQPQERRYDTNQWRYDTGPAGPPAQAPPQPESFSAAVSRLVGPRALQDETLQNPRCVYQILKKHFQRYTREKVEEVCGTLKETFDKVAEALLSNAGPDRTGAICYAVGWTQHTTGVQIIRAAAILQLLLGNIGRPGGGILAL